MRRSEGNRADGGRGRTRKGWWGLSIALLGSGVAAQQGPSGAIAGKITDLYSKPLAHTSITLRNIHSGAAAHAETERSGAYRVSGLAPGEYSLEAENAQLGYGRLTGIVIVAGHEAHVQAALALAPRPAAVTRMTRPEREASDRREAGEIPVMLSRDTSARKDELPFAGRPTPERSGTLSAAGGGDKRAVGEPQPQANMDLAKVATVAIRNGGDSEPEPTVTPEGMTPLPHFAITLHGLLPAASMTAIASVSAISAGIQHRETGRVLAAVCGVEAQWHATWPHKRNIELAGSPAPLESVTGEELQQLPLTERDWASVLVDRPEEGTGVLEEDAGGKGSAAVERHPGRSYDLDGSSIRSAFGGAWDTAARGGSLSWAGQDESLIGEASAARGSVLPGRGTDITTRRGMPELHGLASVVNRQNLWEAQNPFTVWVKEVSPSKAGGFPLFESVPYTAGDRNLSWNLNGGGRIRSKQLFWFGGVDNAARNNPAVATVRHPDHFFAQPSDDEMRVLSARLGLSSADPVGEGLTAYSGGLRQLAALLGPAPRSSMRWAGFGRLDWEGLERHKFTLEGLGGLWNSPGGGMRRASETYAAHSFGMERTSETWIMGRWQAFFTSNLLMTTQASLGRHIFSSVPETPLAYEQSLLASAWKSLPQMVVDGRYGFTMGNPARFGPGSDPDERFAEGHESLDWVRGNLLLRSGFELRHDADAAGFVRNHLGTFAYSQVENFIADALVFAKYGLSDALDPVNEHNCDSRGKAWRDASGQLYGLGYLPCYSYYTQTMGPTDWHLSTNDWAGFTTVQWQPAKRLVMSMGMRWQRLEVPPAIGKVANLDLLLAGRLTSGGNEWAPRASLAWGSGESRWPVIEAGYGLYFARTPNTVFETLLTQTGSLHGDLNFFLRPVDNLAAGGAPPFPYVLTGEPTTVVKPGAVEMRSGFRNPEIHQGEMTLQERLPGKVEISASAQVSLARHLPVTQDVNFDPAVNPGTITYSVVDASGKGPLHGEVTVPFFASWPDSIAGGRLHSGYQQIVELSSRANSTYEAAVVRVTRSGRRGLTFHSRYTYSHAMDWNPNESTRLTGSSMLDPTNFGLEYGTSDLDVRHSGSASLIWQSPWRVKSLGAFTDGWMLSAIGQFRSGLPYTMRTAGTVSEKILVGGTAIAGLSTGMNGSGGDDRVYGVGRNTFRYPMTWKADVRVGKKFELGRMREVQLFAESFNLFNHQNVTLLETTGYSIEPGGAPGTLPTLHYLTGEKSGQTQFGMPLDVNATDFFRPRQFDFGMRMRF